MSWFFITGVFLIALAISTVITSLMIKYLTKHNLVKKATDDRWHKNPTPVFGGVGIFIAFVVTSLLFIKMDKSLIFLIGTGALMFFTGLIDDLKRISPPAKLTAQFIGASAIVISGFAMPLTPNIYLNMAISLFLIVGLTNSFNLLDNMDGLSAGVAIVVLIARGCFFAFDNDWQGLILTVVLIGSIGGFLIYNYHPAKIFMGDCGSLLIGFTVAALFVIAPHNSNSGIEKNILLLTLLAIPLFDTFFVSITRKIGGRKISQGGRDHLSHRLVKAGLSESYAVALLWMIAGFIGFTSFFLYATQEYSTSAIMATIIVLFSILFGRYLSKPEKGMGAPASENALTIVKIFYQFKYKRYMLQTIIDITCIATSYYTAYLLRFQNLSEANQLNNFLFSIFIVVPSILLFLSLSGVYRGTWKYIDIPDVISIFKGILLGSAISIFFLTFFFHFGSFSRAVLINNALILMIVLPATRASYRFFDELIYKLKDKKVLKKVLIYGAGVNGEYLIRTMKRELIENISIVGLIDDDPGLTLNSIMGAKVLGTINDLNTIMKRNKIDEILISTNKITDENIRKLIKISSNNNGVKLYKEEHTLTKAELPLVLAS